MALRHSAVHFNQAAANCGKYHSLTCAIIHLTRLLLIRPPVLAVSCAQSPSDLDAPPTPPPCDARELPRSIGGIKHPARVQHSRYGLHTALEHIAHDAHTLQYPQHTARTPPTCSSLTRLLCLHVQVV